MDSIVTQFHGEKSMYGINSSFRGQDPGSLDLLQTLVYEIESSLIFFDHWGVDQSWGIGRWTAVIKVKWCFMWCDKKEMKQHGRLLQRCAYYVAAFGFILKLSNLDNMPISDFIFTKLQHVVTAVRSGVEQEVVCVWDKIDKIVKLIICINAHKCVSSHAAWHLVHYNLPHCVPSVLISPRHTHTQTHPPAGVTSESWESLCN